MRLKTDNKMIDTEKIVRQSKFARLLRVERQYITQLITDERLNTVTIAGVKFVILDQKAENLLNNKK